MTGPSGYDLVWPDFAEVLWAIAVLALFGLWVWAVVDILRRPSEQFARANTSKVVWVTIVVLFSTIGTVAYLAYLRPKLRAMA